MCLPRRTQSKKFRVPGFLRRRSVVFPPCFLYVHRSFTFGRHPSSVSIASHRHFIFSRRSFLGHVQVESLSGWVTTCSGYARLLYFGRACFGMEGDNGFTCLSSSRYFPTRFFYQLSIRGYVQMMSRGISLFSKSNPAINDSNLHVSAG